MKPDNKQKLKKYSYNIIYRERTFWLIKFEDELQMTVDSFEFCTENNFIKGCDFILLQYKITVFFVYKL